MDMEHFSDQDFAEERRKKIVNLIRRDKRVTVNQLVELCLVSAGTVRNDLKELEQAGMLVRTHGGAVVPTVPVRGEIALPLREGTNTDKKEAIAREAVKLIKDGESVFLDAGTTSLALARELSRTDRSFIAVVNDFHIAEALEESERGQIVFIGGVVRKKNHNTSGRVDLDMLKRYMVEKVFLTADAVSADKGATTYLVQDIQYKRIVMANAAKKIILADSTKLGRHVFAQFASVEEIDTVVTDSAADAAIVSELEEKGVEVFVAP
ncbi:MAG: transcriptional regulator, DeoR family [Paenibacillaceae bacterium]|jgi:DeoR family fructose operon transcriptional repressor|nr:transcriptional regulator, DeoR family [Paenibacillaceae bacterium]